jgi:hypothetical protein
MIPASVTGRPGGFACLTAKRPYAACRPGRRLSVSQTVTSELRAEPGEAWVRDEAQAVHPGRHRRAPEARSSYCEVFAIGEFRALWSAQVLSFAGDQFAQVAIAILVYGRTHSPFLTAPPMRSPTCRRSRAARCCPAWRTCTRAAA